MITPPPGDAYLFMISRKLFCTLLFLEIHSELPAVSSYSLAIINAFVSFGLLLLYTSPYHEWSWNPPFQAPKFIIILFFLSNVFLVVVPLIPPIPGSRTYDHLPYWVSTYSSFFDSVFLTSPASWTYIWIAPRLRGVSCFIDWCIILVHEMHLAPEEEWV